MTSSNITSPGGIDLDTDHYFVSAAVPARRAADPDALTDAQVAVLRAFHEFGVPMDDQALAVYVHHIEDEPMSSSSVRSRRAELSRGDTPLVQVVATKTLRSGRSAAVHALTSEGKAAARKLFA